MSPLPPRTSGGDIAVLESGAVFGVGAVTFYTPTTRRWRYLVCRGATAITDTSKLFASYSLAASQGVVIHVSRSLHEYYDHYPEDGLPAITCHYITFRRAVSV